LWCLHTGAAPTQPSSELNESRHHIQIPAPSLASLFRGQHCAALFPAVVSSRMLDLTTDSLHSAGQSMSSVVPPCSCTSVTTLHIGAQDEWFRCSSISLLLHVLASPTANHCCLEPKIMGPGVSSDSPVNAPRGLGGSQPRMDLSCRLRRRWRSSRLPTSLWCHQGVLPFSATTRMNAIWMPLRFEERPRV
jgi:hypothetical protein